MLDRALQCCQRPCFDPALAPLQNRRLWARPPSTSLFPFHAAKPPANDNFKTPLPPLGHE